MPRARICQIAMCTNSIPATTRLFTTGLGFASAGGRPLWGQRLADIQGLPSGEATATSLWWLVGRQDFMQLELFTHTTPGQRPLPDSWRPSDLGWVRWGAVVDDFDRALTGLERCGVETITAPVADDGPRRVCFREPGAQVIVELIERDHAAPTSDRQAFYDLGAAVRYVTASVSDLAATRALFLAAGLTDGAGLHRPGDEARWGLDGAQGQVAVLTDGDVDLELVAYSDPVGAPKPDGYLLSDQGFMNVALGFRDRRELNDAFDALLAAGCTSPTRPPEVAGGTYVTTPGNLSIEMLVAPREVDPEYGFTPLPTFPRPLIWPRPR